MKKSSSQIKLSDLKNFTPSPIRKNSISQPGKPPPQPHIKPDASPNYMKSTSSFDARKIPASCPNNKTSPDKDGKIYGGRFSEPKNITRSSSLTLIRTLTKTPTFKPARNSSKKCSPAGICSEMDSQRSTCSSTLKDYKFPAYLELNHGGTESEGTSVWKVCPYTYCSLNGHRHSSLPPLKSFLSSRRRSLKALSTPGIKLADDMIEQVAAVEAARKDDLDDLPTSPLVGEAESDFFVEIYCDERPKSEMESGEEIAAGSFCCESPVEEVEFSEDDEFGDSESNKIEWEEHQYLSTEIDKTDEDYNIKTGNESENKDDLEKLSNKETVDFEDHSDNGDSETNNDQCSEMEISFGDDQYQILAIGDAYESSETESHAEESFVANGVSEAEKDSEIKENDEAPSFCQQNQDPQYEIDICDQNVQTGKEEQINDLPSTGEIGEFGSADILNDDLTEEIETSQSSTWATEESLEQRESVEDEEEEEKTSFEHENGILEEQLDSCRELKGTIRSKSSMEEEEERKFNPKEPNFLPIGEDPETEKVDLRPQTVDDRKNSEEWMLDYALQRAVTKLAPARKKKVALLVEAFETVLPTSSKCEEAHLIHSPVAFAQPKHIQACF